jgi:CRP-like cAMP-binding protein
MTSPTPEVPTAAGEAFPRLTTEQLVRLRSYGTAQDVAVGDTVFQAGDKSMDLVVIDEGKVDIVRPPTHERPEEVVASHGAGRFLGELTLLTGQVAYLTGRVVEAGHIHRISPQRFRQLMDADPELSDLLLRAFLARRMFLRAGAAAQAVEILGSSLSSGTLALRTYAARQLLPHVWLDSDDGEKEVSLMATSYAYPRDFARVGLDFGIIRVGAPIAVSRALSMMDDAPPFDGETLGCPEALAGSPTAQARVSVGAFEVTLGSNLLTYKRDRAAPGMSGGPVVSTSNVYGVYVGAGYATDRALECATPLDGGVLQACRNAAASPFGRCS